MSSKIKTGTVLLAVLLMGLSLACDQSQETTDGSTAGGDTGKAVATLKALDDANPQVRQGAVLAILETDPTNTDHIPLMRKALGDEIYDVRFVAYVSLHGLGAAAGPAVPELTKVLAHGDGNDCMAAAGILAQIGSAAKDAIPELERLARDGVDEHVRKAAKDAIGSIQGAQ